MTTHLSRLLLVLAWMLPAVAALGGCRSMSDVIRSKETGEGTTRLHAADCDAAYALSIQVFRDEGAEALEEHKSERYILTSSGMGLFSYGTLMGAWFEPEKTGKCAVTAVTKRKIATNVVTTLTEGTFHDRLAEAIARIPAATKKSVIVPASAPATASPPAPVAEPAKPATDTKATPAKKKPSKTKTPAKKAPAKKSDEASKTAKSKDAPAAATKDAAPAT